MSFMKEYHLSSQEDSTLFYYVSPVGHCSVFTVLSLSLISDLVTVTEIPCICLSGKEYAFPTFFQVFRENNFFFRRKYSKHNIRKKVFFLKDTSSRRIRHIISVT